jgi:glycosyltransferase involved in cell wall biosynthesis
MHWPPNAEGISWFTREVWSQVQREVPDVVLTVIGKNPPASLTQANGHLRNVEVPGYVSDITPYLSETAAFIVPLHAGGGMRVKILDAWNWGLPVVSTSIGAEGLRYEDGENLLLADNPEKFARAVISLLREPALASAVAVAGRKTVEESYDWRKIYKAWDKIYGTVQ